MNITKTKINKRNPNRLGSDGFTIVEILIATTIFSIVLTMTIIVVIDFTHHYFKAVNSSTTQNSTRIVLNDVTQAIEFSQDAVTPVTSDLSSPNSSSYTTISSSSTQEYYQYTYCIGAVQFDYVPDFFTSNGSGALWETPNKTPGGLCQPIPLPPGSSSDSKNLLSANLAVLNFLITQDGAGSNLYDVTVELGYTGSSSNDQICDTSVYQSCTATGAFAGDFSNSGYSNTYSDTFGCVQAQAGDYCDVVSLSAVVQDRIVAE